MSISRLPPVKICKWGASLKLVCLDRDVYVVPEAIRTTSKVFDKALENDPNSDEINISYLSEPVISILKFECEETDKIGWKNFRSESPPLPYPPSDSEGEEKHKNENDLVDRKNKEGKSKAWKFNHSLIMFSFQYEFTKSWNELKDYIIKILVVYPVINKYEETTMDTPLWDLSKHPLNIPVDILRSFHNFYIRYYEACVLNDNDGKCQYEIYNSNNSWNIWYLSHIDSVKKSPLNSPNCINNIYTSMLNDISIEEEKVSKQIKRDIALIRDDGVKIIEYVDGTYYLPDIPFHSSKSAFPAKKDVHEMACSIRERRKKYWSTRCGGECQDGSRCVRHTGGGRCWSHK